LKTVVGRAFRRSHLPAAATAVTPFSSFDLWECLLFRKRGADETPKKNPLDRQAFQKKMHPPAWMFPVPA
jgi:hypothetical protein